MMLGAKSLNTSEAHKKLLKSVRNNDTKSIEKLVTGHVGLLHFQYPQPHDQQTILIIACNDKNSMNTVRGDTVRKLIELGASFTEPTKNDRWEAIHYAAINSNRDRLSAIVERLSYEDLNSLVYCSRHVPTKYPFAPPKKVIKSYSNNALNIILKYGKRNEQFLDCCKLLIDKGVSVYQADSNGTRPLDLMRKDEEFTELIGRFNQMETKGKEAFELIKFGLEEEFRNLELGRKEANDIDGPNENLSSCTLLQLCCAKGFTSSVEYLLKKGASPNKILKKKNPNLPIMIAIKEDHEEIVQMLLENSDILLPKDILIALQVKHKSMSMARIDKYMEIILKHLQKYNKDDLRSYLRAQDKLERTPLHFATLYRSSENILELLLLGAPLTEKDIFGHSPLNSIEPSLLETFFDNCVNIPEGEGDIGNIAHTLQNRKQTFSFEISYEALVTEIGKDKTHESEFLFQLIRIKNLNYLMNHPIISSYVEVKWQKFKIGIIINLLLYFIAYASLLFYGFAYTSLAQVSNGFLIVSLILLAVREAFQIVILRANYLKHVDNLIDLVLIGGINYVIIDGWVYDTDRDFFLNQNLRVGFSVVFLSSTLGIFLQLGNLSFFTVKVIVLRQISISFCKYMVFYSFPLLAFFFCFYMLRESPDDVFFQTLYDVVTMFAGDPDSGYPLQFAANPIFSHIIYVVFMVLIGIILQNLLIGLAVSDLQEIKKEAEFIHTKERADYITNTERALLDGYRDAKWIFKKMFRKLIQILNVFQKETVLVIEPYNYGCVYLKERPEKKRYIRDKSIINLFQNIFKDLALRKDKNTKSPYSLKVLYEKMERIEKMMEKLNVNGLLKK